MTADVREAWYTPEMVKKVLKRRIKESGLNDVLNEVSAFYAARLNEREKLKLMLDNIERRSELRTALEADKNE